MWPFKRDKYVRARREAIVQSVQQGTIVLDERLGGGPAHREYNFEGPTLVQPNQPVRKGQAIAKKKRRGSR